MLFEFWPQLRRRSRKPVPATINDIHIPPGTATGAADDSEIKGLYQLFTRKQNSEITSRYVSSRDPSLMISRRARFAFD